MAGLPKRDADIGELDESLTVEEALTRYKKKAHKELHDLDNEAALKTAELEYKAKLKKADLLDSYTKRKSREEVDFLYDYQKNLEALQIKYSAKERKKAKEI